MSVEPVEWKNYPSTETPLAAETLNQQQAYVRSQAEAAAQSAAAAAQSASEAGALTDQAVANVLSEPASETRAVTDALYAPAGSAGVDPGDVGYDIIPLLGQSNMVGRGVPLTSDPAETTDPRVFTFGAQGLHANQITTAEDPLQHWGTITSGAVGPGLPFARRYLSTVNPNRKVLLVPAAQGATAFTGGVKRWKIDHTPAHENLYLLAVRQIELALAAAGPNSRIVGFLWHQGEGDAGSATYADDLDALINAIRSHFGVPQAWFLVGQMSPAGNALSAGKQATNAVHIDTPRRNYYTAFAPVPYGLHRPGDTTHFSAAGARALAESYLRSLPLALANQPGTAPLPPTRLRAVVGTPDVLTVTWERPECRFTGFEVQHRAVGATEWEDWAHDPPMHNVAQITGYVAGNPVEVRVRTVNEQGTSEWTDPEEVTPAAWPADLFPAAPWRAYSLRQLDPSTTSAVRVRRSTDNAEQDIGFTPDGLLDEDALRAFCGAGDGYVRAWYGQAGTPGLSQLDAASQPKIVSAGVVVKERGRPAMLFDGVDDYLYASSPGMTTSGTTFVMTTRVDGFEGPPRVISEGSTSSDVPMYNFFIYPSGAGGSQFRNDDGTLSSISESPDVWATGDTQILAAADDQAAVTLIRDHRLMDPQEREQSGTVTLNRFAIGAFYRTSVTNHTAMALSEVVIWQAAHDPDALADYLADVRAHYSLGGV